VEGSAQVSSRQEILAGIKAALKGEQASALPPVLLHEGSRDRLVDRFKGSLEALAGKVAVVRSRSEADAQVQKILNGRSSIRSTDVFSREAVTRIDAGITSADYALADTGSLVFLTESRESRLLSLLPPCHIAVIESSKIVSGLDDVLTLRPLPGERSSAMVVITGPSRTADIEMRLVRGVHGPGEIHVIIIEEDVTYSD
jgi:L-lactate utilization protein LutC